VRSAAPERGSAGAGRQRSCRTACSRRGGLALHNEEGLQSQQHI